MHTIESSVKLGAYGWLFSPDRTASIFLGLPEEDEVKQERIPGDSIYGKWTQLSRNQSGVISGAVDPGEEGDLRHTISREAGEERGMTAAAGLLIALESIQNGFPVVTVEQKKQNKKPVKFEAIGHQVVLTPEQLLYLQSNFPHLVIQHLAMADFLEHEAQNVLRPFVYVAAWQILESGLLNPAGVQK